jgi:hypothetical protein
MNLRIDKKRISTKEDIHQIYNKAVDELINFALGTNFINQKEIIYFIASRRETNKTLNEKFLRFLNQNHQQQNIVFKIMNPAQEKGLQVVDIVSHAFFRKYEFDDNIEYQIIQDKILIEEKI